MKTLSHIPTLFALTLLTLLNSSVSRAATIPTTADDPAVITRPDYNPGLLRHIVLFRYRDGVTAAERDEVKRRFLALTRLCRRDGKPYVIAIETGAQSSGEGAARGLEQGFIVTFASEGDRNYYVGTPVVTNPAYFEPAHAAFKTFVGPLLRSDASGVLVFDYTVEASARQRR